MPVQNNFWKDCQAWLRRFVQEGGAQKTQEGQRGEHGHAPSEHGVQSGQRRIHGEGFPCLLGSEWIRM